MHQHNDCKHSSKSTTELGGGEKTEVIAVVGQAADLNPLEGLQWRSRRGHMAVLPTDTTLACSATVNE